MIFVSSLINSSLILSFMFGLNRMACFPSCIDSIDDV